METHFEALQVSRTPGFHWFGYYDKFQLDPSDRFLLGMEVAFEHRLPTSQGVWLASRNEAGVIA
ncbi:MAG: hypothetical protein WKF77_22650 [Planctomycetaceae bacterium]